MLGTGGNDNLFWRTIQRVFAAEFFRQSLFFNSGVPSTAVYLVMPPAMAAVAASLMCCGVSKSGSPEPRLAMLYPAAFNSLALAETATVGDGLIRSMRFSERNHGICHENMNYKAKASFYINGKRCVISWTCRFYSFRRFI